MKAFVAMGALVALLTVPGAMAVVSTNDLVGPVGAAAEPLGMGALVGAFPIFYLNDDGTVWQESNGISGLQTTAVHDVETGVKIADPDTLVSQAPGAPAVPEMPALPTL